MEMTNNKINEIDAKIDANMEMTNAKINEIDANMDMTNAKIDSLQTDIRTIMDILIENQNHV